MQLTVQQPPLEEMFGQGNLYNTLYGLQRMAQANNNQAQNLGQAQQDQTFEAQAQPGKLLQQTADIGHTNALTGIANAQVPGIQADSTLKTNQADADSAVGADTRRKAALSKYVTGITKEEADSHEAQARSDLFSPDPVKRKNAQLVLDNMPEIRAKLRMVAAEGANQMAVANANNASREGIANADRDAGKFNKNTTESLLLKMEGGNFQQQAGAANIRMNMALEEASQASTPEEKAGAMARAERYHQQAEAATVKDYTAKQASGMATNAGKLDVAPLVGGKNVVDVNSLPTPPQTPQQTQTPKSGPQAGSVVDHNGTKYRFKGGDPAQPSNWEKM